jgi:hypothetical protein
MNAIPLLYEHEALHLLEALRRDLPHQLLNAERGGAEADWHRYNARISLRLLEILNPRIRQRGKDRRQHLAAIDAVYVGY